MINRWDDLVTTALLGTDRRAPSFARASRAEHEPTRRRCWPGRPASAVALRAGARLPQVPDRHRPVRGDA